MKQLKPIACVVASASMASFSKPVQVEEGEQPTMATVPCYEVELTTVKERHGTLTLRFAGDELVPAQEALKQDTKVTVLLEVDDNQSAE